MTAAFAGALVGTAALAAGADPKRRQIGAFKDALTTGFGRVEPSEGVMAGVPPPSQSNVGKMVPDSFGDH
jgi:hypothetical protein